MVRRRIHEEEELVVSIPTYFKCPISLEVMKSPVSLCTGVTYDRANIQRWFDSGHTTCPATMQTLRSTAFTPNLTLLTLIRSWQQQSSSATQPLSSAAAQFFVRQLIQPRSALASASIVDSLSKIAAFIEQDPARSREMVDCVNVVVGVFREWNGDLDVAEAALRVLSLVEMEGKVAEEIDWNWLLAVMQRGRVEARVYSAGVLESTVGVWCNEDEDHPVAETEGVLRELIRLMSSENGETVVEAGLSCLVAVSARRKKLRPLIVRLGAVQLLGELLLVSESMGIAEKALTMVETLSRCAEGRAAICEDSACVPALVRRMLKVSGAGTERAVVVLWSVCYAFRDQKAQEAVARSKGLTKILLLMQSNCSPVARQMCGDLVKIFKVNSKSCLSSYDTKTTHIMPF